MGGATTTSSSVVAVTLVSRPVSVVQVAQIAGTQGVMMPVAVTVALGRSRLIVGTVA